MSWTDRFRNLWRRDRLSRDIDRELSFHLAERIDDLRAGGMNEHEATQTARRQLGNYTLMKERTHEIDILTWLDAIARDFRYGARTLLKTPAFTCAAVLSLALGIGATSGIFSVVDAVLLKPLPYPASDRLVRLYERNLLSSTAESMIAPIRMEDWNRQNQTFEAIAGSYNDNVTDTSASPPERLSAQRVSPRFFDVLGTPAALGRTFNSDEEQFGGPQAAVISARYWHQRFNGNPDTLGKSLVLGGRVHTIVGIMPASFTYPSSRVDVWLPVQMHPEIMRLRNARFYFGIGRMKPGITRDQALADLHAVQARLAIQFPGTDKGWGVIARSLKEEEVGGVRRSLWMLLAAVGLLLAIACGNVASLMLARVERRGREVAVRLALGARSGTVVRQLLIEGLLLAMAGGAAGLALAIWSVEYLRRLGPQVPRLGEVHLDARLVVFTAALCLLTTLLFAIAPAFQSVRNSLLGVFVQGSRSQVSGRHPLQRFLVTTQVALTLVLLVGAGLLLRSFQQLGQVSPGFDSDGVLTFRLTAEWTEDRTLVAARQTRVLAALMEIPGVESAALTNFLPLTPFRILPTEFRIDGQPDPQEKAFVQMRIIAADYFRTLRIPVLAGSGCEPFRVQAKPRVLVLVNRKFVDTHLPGGPVLGRTITVTQAPPATIAGIVENVRETSLAEEPPPVIYLCTQPGSWPDPNYLVRTSNLGALAPAIRAKMAFVDPTRGVYSMQPLTEAVATTLRQPRFNSLLLSLFAGTALLLASAGLYGLLSYFVAERTQEIGLRGALGAEPAQIIAYVVRAGMMTTLIGIAAGLGAALALGQWLAGLLFGVRPYDPLSLVAASSAMLLVAAAACLLPALRATRIDPIEALRVE